MATLDESVGLRTVAKLLAALTFGAASRGALSYAIAKLDDAGDPDGYFTRIASLTLRTSWGRYPDAPSEESLALARISFAQRLAVQLANRSFWGRGGTTSEERTPLYRLPTVDRLALEMAANEDVERRAFAGELGALREAWREAEEIAAIADAMFVGDVFDEFKRRYDAHEARSG